MPATVTRRAPGRPLKSPLAAPSGRPASSPVPQQSPDPARAQLPPREMQLSEFADYLRTITSPKTERPYEESTIDTYVYPPRT